MFFDTFSDLCKQNGVTPNKALVDCKISRTSVAKWKKGAIPNGSTLSKIADYFGVTTDYLLSGERKESTPTGESVFYDLFCELCKKKGISVTKATVEIGLSRTIGTAWKQRGLTPKGDTLAKIADYFGVTTDYLLGTETEKAPTPEGEREIGFDDFTYAFNGEVKELTESDKQLLLSMARQLNEARKQRDGKKTD